MIFTRLLGKQIFSKQIKLSSIAEMKLVDAKYVRAEQFGIDI